jgi:Tol biopolymer transport system component
MTRVSRWMLIIAGLALLAGHPGAQQATPAALLLESASQKATLEGDLRGAIRIYQDVVSRFAKSDRPAAATALLRIAECYEKLGDSQASRFFERVISEYADQATTAAAARARLSSGMPRLICEECGDPLGSTTTDGRYMATVMPYVGGGDRMGDVGLLDLATNKLTPLQIEGSGKSAPGGALFPVVSPDGRQVVYSWSSDRGVGFRIVPREPAGRMRALPNPGGYGIMMPLAWASSGILALGQKADDTLELFLVSPADGAQKPLKQMRFSVSPGSHVASLSADGRFVAYEQYVTEPTGFVNQRQGEKLDRQIHAIAIDGSSDVPITRGAGVKRGPVWTPNGSHVLYVSNVTGTLDLWATPMRDGKPSGEPVLVKKSVANDVETLGMSASGQYFFYEGRIGVFKTSIVPVTASSPRTAAAQEAFIGERPAWSPDGTRVAVSRPGPDGMNGVDIVVRTLSTGDERVFKREGILNFPTMWFPDGHALLVQVREAANQVFWYRIDVTSGEFQRLAQQRGNSAFWTHRDVRTLSADGRTLYFGTYANQTDPQLDRITALDLATGSYREVVRLPVDKDSMPRAAQDIALAASPDGRSLAVMHRDPKLNVAHLAVVGVDGQGYRELTAPVQAVNLRDKLVWSRDGRWVYFTTRTGDPDDDLHRVMRIPAAGGTPEPAGLEAEGLECFDVSPDGTRFAFSTLRPEGWGQLLWSLDVAWLMKAPR